MKESKNITKLNAKPNNGFGIVALILAVISYVLIAVSIYVSAFYGQASSAVIGSGICEWMSFMLTIAAWGLGFMGMHDEETEHTVNQISFGFLALGSIYHLIVIYQGFIAG